MCSAPFAPIVVAKQSFLNQTGTVATTTLFTPSADGDFLVCITSDCNSAGGGAQGVLSWTDDFASPENQFNITHDSAENNFVQPMHVLSGDPITISAEENSSGTTYSIYAIVIQI